VTAQLTRIQAATCQMEVDFAADRLHGPTPRMSTHNRLMEPNVSRETLSFRHGALFRSPPSLALAHTTHPKGNKLQSRRGSGLGVPIQPHPLTCHARRGTPAPPPNT
jgi:hypothetical protein